MTIQLDRMLDHRETIVYRVPRRWEPNGWGKEYSAFAIALATAATMGLVRFDIASLASLGAGLAGFMIYMVCCYIHDWSREAVVTDRRLLYRSGWREPTVVEVRVEDVVKVDAAQDRVRFTRRDGTKLDLRHPQDGWGMGVALASAAGLPPPRLQPRREVVADYVWLVCSMTTGIVAALIPLKALYPHAVDLAASIGWPITAAGLLFLGSLSFLIGAILGGKMVPFLLRPFFRFEEMDAWIMNSSLFWPHPKLPDDPGPEISSTRRLSHWLYGRTLAPSDATASSHGR